MHNPDPISIGKSEMCIVVAGWTRINISLFENAKIFFVVGDHIYTIYESGEQDYFTLTRDTSTRELMLKGDGICTICLINAYRS